MSKYNPYKGKKFNKLEMLYKSRSGGANIGILWIAQCDCGNLLEVVAKDVRAGRRKSCGNCHTRLGIQPVVHPIPKGRRAEYRRLVREAGGPGPHLEISISDFNALIGKRCLICAKQGGQLYWTSLKCERISQNLCTLCDTCRGHWNGDNIAKFLEYILRAAQCLRNQIAGN